MKTSVIKNYNAQVSTYTGPTKLKLYSYMYKYCTNIHKPYSIMYIQTVPLNRSSYRILWSIQPQQVTEKINTLLHAIYGAITDNQRKTLGRTSVTSCCNNSLVITIITIIPWNTFLLMMVPINIWSINQQYCSHLALLLCK